MLQLSRGIDGEPLTADGVPYPTGIGTHAASVITVQVDDPLEVLAGSCIYPDHVWDGAVVCTIDGDQGPVFKSAVLDSTQRKDSFIVPVPASRVLTFRVQPATGSINQAHAAWVDLH